MLAIEHLCGQLEGWMDGWMDGRGSEGGRIRREGWRRRRKGGREGGWMDDGRMKGGRSGREHGWMATTQKANKRLFWRLLDSV